MLVGPLGQCHHTQHQGTRHHHNPHQTRPTRRTVQVRLQVTGLLE